MKTPKMAENSAKMVTQNEKNTDDDVYPKSGSIFHTNLFIDIQQAHDLNYFLPP